MDGFRLLVLILWGHSPGGRVDDEAVSANGGGKIFGSSEFVTASAVWLWICSANDILLLND